MKSTVLASVTVSACGLLSFCVATLAHAGNCTNATLSGAYGIQEQGQFPGAGFKEFRSVGVLSFDGHGAGSRTSTIWYSDLTVASELPFQVTYSVNADCTFSLVYGSNGEVFTGTIVNGGQKLLYLEVSADPMRTGQAEKIKLGD